MRHHGGSIPVPVEYLLSPDPELWLATAPLIPTNESDDACVYGACESDDYCTCQEAIEHEDEEDEDV